jgi:uncharacterized protein (DUF2336 family)
VAGGRGRVVKVDLHLLALKEAVTEETKMVGAHQDLIGELEDMIAAKDIGRRAAMLRRVTDLFALGSGKLSDEQISLFDDVMSRLVDEIEISARATFGHVLATIPDAPPKVVRRLALDDAIDVAGPILSHSGRVDDMTLVEGAKTKGQAHLLAISRREVLVEAVTDILVERGNQQVALSTAGNSGAAFSEFGYSTLVQRSSNDDDLAVCIWSRPEIPRQHLLKLFADASEAVKLKLAVRDPRKGDLTREIVAQASNQIQTQTREKSASYAAAHAHVQSLHESGSLGETQLAEFACLGKFDETALALSMMCNLPIGVIEHALVDDRSEQILVLAKAIGLSWQTAKAILLLRAGTKNGSTRKFDLHFETFIRLKMETAKKAIQFYRLRARAAMPRSN